MSKLHGYVKVTCPHPDCEVVQAVNVAKLCNEQRTFALGGKSSLRVRCKNPDCPKKVFKIKIDCSEYE